MKKEEKKKERKDWGCMAGQVDDEDHDYNN
jgi:hypothetical protein